MIAATNTIISLSAAVFITIGGDRAAWKSYVNVNYNSYWESEARP